VWWNLFKNGVKLIKLKIFNKKSYGK
jgi:hypothetical protein